MKTESRFSGVCIGGPYDGRQFVHSSPTLEVRTLPEMSTSIADLSAEPSMMVETELSIYDYVPITHKQGVWLHESQRREGVGLSVSAVGVLVENYANK